MGVKSPKKVHFNLRPPSATPPQPSSSPHQQQQQQQQQPAPKNPFRQPSLLQPGFHKPYRSDASTPTQQAISASDAFQGPARPMSREFMEAMMNPDPAPVQAAGATAEGMIQQMGMPESGYQAPTVVPEFDWNYTGPPLTWASLADEVDPDVERKEGSTQHATPSQVSPPTATGKQQTMPTAQGYRAPSVAHTKPITSQKRFPPTKGYPALQPTDRGGGSHGNGYRAPGVVHQMPAKPCVVHGEVQHSWNTSTPAPRTAPPTASVQHKPHPSPTPQRYSSPPPYIPSAAPSHHSNPHFPISFPQPAQKSRTQPQHPPPPPYHQPPQPHHPTPPPPPEQQHPMPPLPGSFPPPPPPPPPRHTTFTISSTNPTPTPTAAPPLPRHAGFTITSAPVQPLGVHAGFLTTSAPVTIERVGSVRVRWDERIGAWVPEE